MKRPSVDTKNLEMGENLDGWVAQILRNKSITILATQ